MRENPLKAIWREGRAAINMWCNMPSSLGAEAMAAAGPDAVTVDMQHSLTSIETAMAMLQGIGNTGAVPMARTTWNEPWVIMHLLDAGAMGIICPMINDRTEAEAFIGACRYPPKGYRSFGPVRAGIVHGPTYAANANDQIVCFGMIETPRALVNLEEIVTTPGLDGVYIGPNDLSLAMGKTPAIDTNDPDVLKEIERICKTARGAGIQAGIHCATPAYAKRMIQLGFTFVTISGDMVLINRGSKEAVAEMRS